MNKSSLGWINGFIGVAFFSASLPATRVMVLEMSPIFATAARSVIGALLAVFMIFILKQKLPKREYWLDLFLISLCLVIGFPTLTALALEHISASHSLIYIGALPLMTAMFGALMERKKLSKGFWFFSILGSLIIGVYAFDQSVNTSLSGNLYMLCAIIVCGYGYAKSGVLTRDLGGWQVMGWALIIMLPLMLLLSILWLPENYSSISVNAYVALLYVGIFSALIGFLFWNKGLEQGGISNISQLQLLQPFMGLMLAAFLLNEVIELKLILSAILVLACVIGTKWANKV